jgi:putative addiction module antidote
MDGAIERAETGLERVVCAGEDLAREAIIMSIRTEGVMLTLKLIKVGTSTGLMIPKEMLLRLKVETGDALYAVETADEYWLTPYDPAIEEQLRLGQEFMKEYCETFKALAK